MKKRRNKNTNKIKYKYKNKEVSITKILIHSFVILSFILITLYVKVTTSAIKYEIGKIQKRISKVSDDNNYLKIKISQLNAVNRVEKIAKVEMDMYIPEHRPKQYFFLRVN